MSKKGHTRVQGDRGFKKLGEMLDFSAKVASEHLPGSQVEAALKVRGVSGELRSNVVSEEKLMWMGAQALSRHILGPISPNEEVQGLTILIMNIQKSLQHIAHAAGSIDQNGIHIAQV